MPSSAVIVPIPALSGSYRLWVSKNERWMAGQVFLQKEPGKMQYYKAPWAYQDSRTPVIQFERSSYTLCDNQTNRCSRAEGIILAPPTDSGGVCVLKPSDPPVLHRLDGNRVPLVAPPDKELRHVLTDVDCQVSVVIYERQYEALVVGLDRRGAESWRRQLRRGKPALSSDGRLLAYAGEKLHLFDAASGEELWSLDWTDWDERRWDRPQRLAFEGSSAEYLAIYTGKELVIIPLGPQQSKPWLQEKEPITTKRPQLEEERSLDKPAWVHAIDVDLGKVLEMMPFGERVVLLKWVKKGSDSTRMLGLSDAKRSRSRLYVVDLERETVSEIEDTRIVDNSPMTFAFDVEGRIVTPVGE